MPLYEALRLALQTVWSHKLRSFFTLLGVIVSVAFLVAVVAVIQGMNAYVRERLAGAIVGVNAFQIRRDPIQVGFIDDEAWKQIQRRPIIAPEDVAFIARAVPDAEAISLQSGWPTPMADVQWRNRTTGDVFIFGVTAPFVVVQDYKFAAGEPLTDIDLDQRRYVAVLGYDVAEKLLGNVHAAVGSKIRVRGMQLTVKGVIAKKGTVLGQSWDGFVMLPLTTFESMYGRRQRFHGRYRRRIDRVLEQAHARDLYRRPGRRRHRHCRWRHRDHEHHAHERDRAHARDRHSQSAGCFAQRHPAPVLR